MNYEQTLENAVKLRFEARKVTKPDEIGEIAWGLSKKDIVNSQGRAIAIEAKEDAEQLLIQYTKDSDKPADSSSWQQMGDKFMYIIEQEMKAWIERELG